MCICTRDRGCGAHPAFPAPSDFREGKRNANLGQNMSRDREVTSGRHPRAGGGGGGFTLEVQRLSKGLRRGPVVKAFARRVVVDGHELSETACRERCEVGFAGHEAAHSSDRVLDAALLPGRVWVAEEGVDREAV